MTCCKTVRGVRLSLRGRGWNRGKGSRNQLGETHGVLDLLDVLRVARE